MEESRDWVCVCVVEKNKWRLYNNWDSQTNVLLLLNELLIISQIYYIYDKFIYSFYNTQFTGK